MRDRGVGRKSGRRLLATLGARQGDDNNGEPDGGRGAAWCCPQGPSVQGPGSGAVGSCSAIHGSGYRPSFVRAQGERVAAGGLGDVASGVGGFRFLAECGSQGHVGSDRPSRIGRRRKGRAATARSPFRDPFPAAARRFGGLAPRPERLLLAGGRSMCRVQGNRKSVRLATTGQVDRLPERIG
jgi:hypothetical protein